MWKHKEVMAFAALFCILLVIECTGAEVPLAKNGDNVSIKYTAKFDNGTVFDSSGNNTLTFVIGSKEVVKGVDYAVIGMKKGENKTVTISPEDAYGPHLAELTRIENITTLKNAGYSTRIGTKIKVTLNNNTEEGVITQVNNTSALIDFNKPLAGKTLIFDIILMSINEKSSNSFQ